MMRENFAVKLKKLNFKLSVYIFVWNDHCLVLLPNVA
jgi:hypothetical protein